MKIIIIEDEKFTAEDLAKTISSVASDAEIEALIYSVGDAISYFKKNEAPDLIFSDIQLGDGLSFKIFKSVNVDAPVIFCTAFDEYALNAFKTNGIDYILKPYTRKTIAGALDKYRNLRQSFLGNASQYDAVLEALKNRDTPKSATILVHHKDKILPIKLENIALFYIEDEMTHLLTFDNKIYFINKKLEDLDKASGNSFFRVNRQHLINRKAIDYVSHYFSRKLSINIVVPFKEKIIPSLNKTQEFLNWLENT